ncbi:RidA family protein [Micromonospora sp. NBC_00389]|uniref:RidA family protein n=1 Tax=Micromonospora sp. NBC_00389 TaxID=2903586 RepID=UPI002E2019B6
MSTKLDTYNPDTLGPAIAPYSQAVVANGFAYLAGQVALDKDNNVVAPGDMKKQTRVAIERIKTILAEFDADLNNIVSATVFITDLDDFATFNEAWAAEFGDHRPARASVVAGLLLPGLVVEIQAVAAL